VKSVRNAEVAESQSALRIMLFSFDECSFANSSQVQRDWAFASGY
jgi:hypothetical protein